MILLEHYWMGRHLDYGDDLTPEVTGNAVVLLERVNVLLELAARDGVHPAMDSTTGTPVSSGWRPRPINDALPNASRTSKHIIGCAIDLRDTLPGRLLARWCLRNRKVLEDIRLWMEDPRWTPDWVHVQSLPPGSGNRVFVPSASPALAAMLPEQSG